MFPFSRRVNNQEMPSAHRHEEALPKEEEHGIEWSAESSQVLLSNFSELYTQLTEASPTVELEDAATELIEQYADDPAVQGAMAKVLCMVSTVVAMERAKEGEPIHIGAVRAIFDSVEERVAQISEEDEEVDWQQFTLSIFTEIQTALQEGYKELFEEEQDAASVSEEDTIDYDEYDGYYDYDVDEDDEQYYWTASEIATAKVTEEAAAIEDNTAVRHITAGGWVAEEADMTLRGIQVVEANTAEQFHRWSKMLDVGLIRGKKRKGAIGVVFEIEYMPFDWFLEGKETFFQKNAAHEQWFPGAFSLVKTPEGGTYPQEIFFDRSGKALQYFLSGRWDEYKDSSHYEDYMNRWGKELPHIQ